ncbi:hypothetical protein D3C81_1550170 [compost metagenome]
MASRPSRAYSISGLLRASQRRLAPAFETIDINGWLISWAMEAVSWPTVVARATRARSAWALRSASSALRRVVTSVTVPTYSSVSPSVTSGLPIPST